MHLTCIDGAVTRELHFPSRARRSMVDPVWLFASAEVTDAFGYYCNSRRVGLHGAGDLRMATRSEPLGQGWENHEEWFVGSKKHMR